VSEPRNAGRSSRGSSTFSRAQERRAQQQHRLPPRVARARTYDIVHGGARWVVGRASDQDDRVAACLPPQIFDDTFPRPQVQALAVGAALALVNDAAVVIFSLQHDPIHVRRAPSAPGRRIPRVPTQQTDANEGQGGGFSQHSRGQFVGIASLPRARTQGSPPSLPSRASRSAPTQAHLT
jgi:hypothetical protein